MSIHQDYVVLYNQEGHANLVFDYELTQGRFKTITKGEDGRLYMEDEVGVVHAIETNSAIQAGVPVIYVTHLRSNKELECFQIAPFLQYEDN